MCEPARRCVQHMYIKKGQRRKRRKEAEGKGEERGRNSIIRRIGE